MITSPHLGYLGRLGNQMFQYATIFSLSHKHKINFSLQKSDLELYNCFNISTKIDSYYNSTFVGPYELGNEIVVSYQTLLPRSLEHRDKILTTKFDSKFYNTNFDQKSIFGFFQNYKYFQEFDNKLRDVFVFKDQYKKICKSYFLQRFYNEKTLSLHIRRTDYLESSVLNNLTLDYYKNALVEFDKSIPVLVFSDDISWCKEQDIFNDDRFIFMESDNTYIDLCLMSLCNYHIIANSSYSWWGSWLAKSEKTICPKQWFSPDYSHLDSDGLRLKEWISI